MTEKKMNLLVVIGLLAAACYYLYKSFTAPAYKMVFIGPYEFPKIIGSVLALLCLIVLVQTIIGEENTAFTISNFPLTGVTVAATCGFLFLWQKFGLFYMWGGIYSLLLLFAYRNEGGRFCRKNICLNLMISTSLMVFVYLAFGVLMRIKL